MFIAYALLNTFCDLAVIKTDFQKTKLNFNSQLNSKFYFTLTGCTNYERNIFVNSFNEIFAINNKNRYILKYKEKYLAIPECLSSHKKRVECFVKYLEEKMGYFDIIYTKNPKNYKELLRAKFNVLDLGHLKQSRIWI